MKEKNPGKLDILELIPQRPPMVMIDRLVSVDSQQARSVFLIGSENIFVQKGLFREEGVIENIAQTAAALNGYREKIGGGSVGKGYIGGLKDLEVHDLPRIGEELTTEVTEIHNVMGVGVLYGECRAGNRLVARCEMKVYIP
jgi:3-hydroxyacyl-[acyl-carrier-protein] dehydratase